MQHHISNPFVIQINPGGRWNSNVMWDAREAMVPGSVYDRQGRSNRAHDPMTRISPHVGNVPGMNVPMGMVMNNQFGKKPPQERGSPFSYLELIFFWFFGIFPAKNTFFKDPNHDLTTP